MYRWRGVWGWCMHTVDCMCTSVSRGDEWARGESQAESRATSSQQQRCLIPNGMHMSGHGFKMQFELWNHCLDEPRLDAADLTPELIFLLSPHSPLLFHLHVSAAAVSLLHSCYPQQERCEGLFKLCTKQIINLTFFFFVVLERRVPFSKSQKALVWTSGPCLPPPLK